MKRFFALVLATILLCGLCTACGSKYPTNRKLKVACVGDSITAGGYWKDNLQETLSADNYEVEGFGKSGATALFDGVDYVQEYVNGPKAFVDQDAYTDSLAFGADIVVIMLGTNDSKDVNWPRYGESFAADYTEIVKAYQNSGSKPTVCIALPPTVYSVGKFQNINNTVIEEEIIPALRTVAEETGAILIDTHTPTQGNEELVKDGVHPSAEGKQVLCETISAAIISETKRK